MDLSHPSYRRAAQACGALVAVAGVAALAGWATGQPVLLGLRASYIPMAPNTALAFIVLGLGLFAVVERLARGPWICRSGCRPGRPGRRPEVDRVRHGCRIRRGPNGSSVSEAGQLGLAPDRQDVAPHRGRVRRGQRRGRGARLADRDGKSLGHAAGVCGLVTGMTGLVFSLGYLFSPNAPLLYGTESIPMALNTALCFLSLGVGLVAAAGPEAFPLVRLSGPSIRARLLRIFLPLVVGTVGVVAWLTHLVTTTAGSSSAAISSAALAAAAIVLFGVICERIAGRVGGQIERAESELQRAHDLLEAQGRRAHPRTEPCRMASSPRLFATPSSPTSRSSKPTSN